MIQQLLIRILSKWIDQQFPERPEFPVRAADRLLDRPRHTIERDQVPDLCMWEAGPVGELVSGRLATVFGQIARGVRA